ncbi:uncharacterized protein [Gossypium hirsutum]|uniref:Uncharacterized protein isoform X3 n=2 Tax=Gossypium TaxID=3633 RepID=A0ABM3BCX5_GOSHI|nr:uncharacterized protein LOC107952300 isoform X3 [Gossypium hirsutum]
MQRSYLISIPFPQHRLLIQCLRKRSLSKTLPTLPSPLLPLSHLKKADGQSFIAGSACKQGKNRERTSKTGSADELNRGYFDDMSELKQHGARKFHAVDVIYSDGRKSKLLIVFDASKLAVPEASLVCLSFRANSQLWSILGASLFMTPLVSPRACNYMRFTRDLLFYCQLQPLRAREICIVEIQQRRHC